MRIQSSTRILVDLLHSGDEVASVAKFAAHFGLPMRLGPSTDNSFLEAELNESVMAWAQGDSAVSICAQAMVAGSSIDAVLQDIKGHLESSGIDTSVPFVVPQT